MKVFVLYNTKQPAMPCTPKRARLLLTAGKAAVYRRFPFTIILKDRSHGDTQPVALKFDPGSKTTGMAVVTNETVVFAANLDHRGEAIKLKLIARAALRSSRRSRKTRYRAARFNNRTRLAGWLPPSVQSRVDNVVSWASKISSLVPISSIDIETVRFDMQKMQDPTIAGVGYQQGTLAGYEIREYLLEKFDRTCVYCDAKDVPLEVEHVQPRSAGGSNRISNLAIACHPCNQRKGNLDVKAFVKDPKRLLSILARCKASLKDAAAVNSSRKAILRELHVIGVPLASWSGGRTKMNRIAQGYAKDHWIDAACVGESGATVSIAATLRPLLVKSMGRGNRQTVASDAYGFPRKQRPKIAKRRESFSTGDIVRASITRGKAVGSFVARISALSTKRFDLATPLGTVGTTAKNLHILQRSDGYQYAA